MFLQSAAPGRGLRRLLIGERERGNAAEQVALRANTRLPTHDAIDALTHPFSHPTH